MTEMSLTVAIVSYNTEELTVAAIQSALDQTDMTDKEIVVFDNASSDNSVEAIENHFPSVRLIKSSENVGFARANNIIAEQTESKLLLLLNPDTVVLDNAIDNLLDFAMKNPDAGIWGGRTLHGDRSLNPLSCFDQMSLWNQFCRASGLAAVFKGTNFFNGEELGGWKRDSVREVDIVSGCFLLIRRELWEQLNGFDKKFFMYAEDADLCLRARQCGAKPLITPRATIVHYGGASERIRSDKMVRLLTAKTELVNSYWPGWKQPMGKAMLLLWVLTRIVAWSIIRPGSEDLSSWKKVWSQRNKWLVGYVGTASQ